MKKSLSIFFTLLLALFASAEEKQVNVSLGAGYANLVFVKLGTDEITTVSSSDWDVMFQRTNPQSTVTRINDARIQVYEVFNNYTSKVTATQWDTVNVSNQAGWKPLYNSDTIWSGGAFERVVKPAGSSAYAFGWGYYDISVHTLYASAIFVLKYPDGTYKKFKIDQYAAGYTISYATWNAATSAWGTTTTTTIPNTTGAGNTYNFFSFTTNSVVASIPADTHWDFVFTKYTADYNGDGSFMYPVTGVLQQYTTKVAKSTDGSIPAASAYTTKMNTIGYDWKTFNGTAYTLSDNKYFVKSSDSTIYKVWFTAFEGSSTGNISFKYTTNLTSGISQEVGTSSLSFAYQAASKELVLQNGADVSNVAVFSLTGRKVFETTVSDSRVLLNNLVSGIYLVRVKSGSEGKQGKIIVP